MSPPFDPRTLRALVFDVFGTVVDWRSSIVREGQMLSATKGLQLDWGAFADAWRAGYEPAMDRTRGAGQAWAPRKSSTCAATSISSCGAQPSSRAAIR